jgi:hypothetical protein
VVTGRESLFAIGQRVVLKRPHAYAGEKGEITNTPGRVFNGWTVRLDSGMNLYVGVSDRHIRRDDDV